MRPQLTVLLLTDYWLALVEIGGSAASCVPATPLTPGQSERAYLACYRPPAAKGETASGLGYIGASLRLSK